MTASSCSSTARCPAIASWRASSASSAATARRSRTSGSSGGPDRVEAPCPHFGTCGGCRWQDLRYERQLEHKQQQVLDALQRIAGLADPPLEPIVPAVREYAYRNKLEYAWTMTDDGVALGFHRAGRWEDIVPIEVCLLTGERGNAVREAFVDWARAAGARGLRPARRHRLSAASGRARGRAHGRAALHPRDRRGRRARGRGAGGAARGARARGRRRAARRQRRRRRGRQRHPDAARSSAAPGSRRRSAACACASRPARSCRRTPRWPTCSTTTRSSRPG